MSSSPPSLHPPSPTSCFPPKCSGGEEPSWDSAVPGASPKDEAEVKRELMSFVPPTRQITAGYGRLRRGTAITPEGPATPNMPIFITAGPSIPLPVPSSMPQPSRACPRQRTFCFKPTHLTFPSLKLTDFKDTSLSEDFEGQTVRPALSAASTPCCSASPTPCSQAPVPTSYHFAFLDCKCANIYYLALPGKVCLRQTAVVP